MAGWLVCLVSLSTVTGWVGDDSAVPSQFYSVEWLNDCLLFSRSKDGRFIIVVLGKGRVLRGLEFGARLAFAVRWVAVVLGTGSNLFEVSGVGLSWVGSSC